jgi:hypothetical protein
MEDLHSRAAGFLRGPCIIDEPGRPLTRLIARYVAGEPWDDPELRNQLSLCLQTAELKAAGHDGATGPQRDARAFYERGAAILRDIQAEVAAGQV